MGKEITFEDIFGDEKKKGLKEFIDKHRDVEMDEFFQESETQRLEGEIYELESKLIDHRDKERIYQEILSDINHSIIELFKREEENVRFNLGETTDYKQCLIGMKEYLDKIKSTYRGKITFKWTSTFGMVIYYTSINHYIMVPLILKLLTQLGRLY